MSFVEPYEDVNSLSLTGFFSKKNKLYTILNLKHWNNYLKNMILILRM